MSSRTWGAWLAVSILHTGGAYQIVVPQSVEAITLRELVTGGSILCEDFAPEPPGGASSQDCQLKNYA